MKQSPEPGLLDQAPIWLHAVLSAVGAAFVSGAIIVTPIFAAWLASAASTVPAMQAVRIGIDVWLLSQAGALHIGTAVLSLVPWLLTLLPLTCLLWSANRVAARLPEGGRPRRAIGGLRRDVLGAGAAFVLAYAVVATLLAVLSRQAAVSASIPRSFVGPALLAVLAYTLAVRGAFRNDLTDLAPGLTWGVREYVPSWVRRGCRPAFVAAAALLAAGMVGALVLIGLNGSRVLGLYDTVDAGWTGSTVLTLGQLAYLPTFGAWALSFAAGPGFGIGDGSSISWSSSQPGYLPLVPVLGALPDPGALPAWVVAFAGVPVLTGVVVGLRCARRVGGAGASFSLRAKAVAFGCALTGVLSSVVMVLSSGSLGASRLGGIGPQTLLAGSALTAEILAGGLLALLVSGLRVGRPRAD